MVCSADFVRKYGQTITVRVLPETDGAQYTLLRRSWKKGDSGNPTDDTFNAEQLSNGISWTLESAMRHELIVAVQTAAAKVRSQIRFADRVALDRVCQRDADPVTCRFTVAVWEDRG